MNNNLNRFTRVLIADDHAVVRRGVKDILLDRYPDLTIGEAKDFKEVLTALNDAAWDLIILDISMPDGNIIDVLNNINRIHPHSPVLILSMFPEEQYAIQMLKSGASGYLTKESVTEELIAAVEKIQRGGKFISPSLAEKLAETVTTGHDMTTHETLSGREFQILLMIASGQSLKHIAETLCISDRTVSTYRSRILKKMNLRTNADLTQYAIHHHLLDLR